MSIKHTSTYQDQLLPSLFDRLTDNEPRKSKETDTQKVMTVAQYRQSVLRDVFFLLNTTRLQQDLINDDLPKNVQTSTLNYGISAFSGYNLADIDWEDIQNIIKSALINFEPRLEESSLKVIVNINEKEEILHNHLIIEIKGYLKLNPYPQAFLLKTSMDIETGMFNLVDGNTNE